MTSLSPSDGTAEAPRVGLYLYFKSRGEPSAVLRALRATDRSMQADGWPAATWWRKHPHAVSDTWMAVHKPLPAGRVGALLAAFDAAARACGLADLIDGARHAERFEPCDVS